MQICKCLLVPQELVQLFSSSQHQKATDLMVDYIMFLNPGANRWMLNPGADRQRMLRGRSFDGDGRLVQWDLSSCKINRLPQLFNTVVCSRDLLLGSNKLQSLPESFSDLTVGKNLGLSSNNLQSLPKSFSNITVGGNLYLYGNPKLNEVPSSFPNVKGKMRKMIKGSSTIECLLEYLYWN